MALNSSDVSAGDNILAAHHNSLIDDIEQHTHDGTDTAAINATYAGDGLALAGAVLSVNVDDSTIETNSDTLRVKDSGITTDKINNDAVTEAKMQSVYDELFFYLWS